MDFGQFAPLLIFLFFFLFPALKKFLEKRKEKQNPELAEQRRRAQEERRQRLLREMEDDEEEEQAAPRYPLQAPPPPAPVTAEKNLTPTSTVAEGYAFHSKIEERAVQTHVPTDSGDHLVSAYYRNLEKAELPPQVQQSVLQQLVVSQSLRQQILFHLILSNPKGFE